MFPNTDMESTPLKPCATVDDPFTSDLAWLMHRAVRVLTEDFDSACQANGLRDMRDPMVLAVAADGTARTQTDIANTLGLEKSTLMSIIDRLEEQGLLTRETDPDNRRIRLPRTTESGQALLDRILRDRDTTVNQTLAGFGADEVRQLRTFLWRIATRQQVN